MDLEQLLLKTLELEGAIRVALNNNSPEAKALLKSKLAALQMPNASPAPPAPSHSEQPAQVEKNAEKPSTQDISSESEVPETTDITETPEQIYTSEPEMQTEPETQTEPENEPKQGPEAAPAATFRRAFTLNDRFYFSRKLFNGSADDFDQTVQIISQMPDMQSVEDFLYVDMMWDAADPVVEEFVTHISQNIAE